MIFEDKDFEEGSTLSKSEVYVGAEEPTTGEKVWFRKGKNHFNGELKAGTFLNGVPNTEMSTTRIRNTEYIGVKNNTDYTISAKYSKTLQINVMIYDEDKKFIKEVGWNNVPYTFTTTDTTKYIMFALRESSNANITTKDITEVQVEPGSKVTPYEDYIEPQIYVRNSNGVYEEFIKNNIKEISFTKNDANAIFYESVYATENEVQICGDIRYSYTNGTILKAFTIDSKYLPIINTSDNKLRYPISTDKGANGYAEVKPNGEVYIYTNGVATAAIINIRYRYK